MNYETMKFSLSVRASLCRAVKNGSELLCTKIFLWFSGPFGGDESLVKCVRDTGLGASERLYRASRGELMNNESMSG